jgi:hypothetical protein
MELKTGYVRNTAFSARSLLMVVALVGVVTVGNLWLHRGGLPLGYARYTGYGFSIEYSQRMTVGEGDLGGYGPPTDSAGMMQGSRQDTELEQFGVIWIRPKGLSTNVDKTPAGALDQIFGFIGISGTSIGVRGELETMTKDGHEVVYQTFTVEESGISIPGIIGAWYCEEAGKFLMLYAIHVPDIYHPEIVSQEVEAIWLGYLDALTCN